MNDTNHVVSLGSSRTATRHASSHVWTYIQKMNIRMKLGFTLVGIFAAFGYLLPLFKPNDPSQWNTYVTDLPSSLQHLFGTTDLGQDTFWLLAVAVRNSLSLGLLVGFLGNAIGVIVGLIAGFKQGWIDRVITLFIDTLIVTPNLPVIIIMGALMKGRTTLLVLGLVMTFFTWAIPARQARAMALSLREREFINTAWFSGASTMKIIIFEILPHTLSWAMASFLNGVFVAIGWEAILAILGLSNLQRPTLGTMIYWANNHQALLSGYWFWVVSPIVAMVILCGALYLLSTGFTELSKLRRS